MESSSIFPCRRSFFSWQHLLRNKSCPFNLTSSLPFPECFDQLLVIDSSEKIMHFLRKYLAVNGRKAFATFKKQKSALADGWTPTNSKAQQI